jgi:DNA replication protein DnaC
MDEKTQDMLKSLKLFGMFQALEQELARAAKEGLSPSEVVHRLVLEEYHYRQERSLDYRIKHSRITWPWTLESFPFDKQPGVNKSQIRELAGLSFLERAENIVFIGDPGTGKTGLAIALMRQAMVSGYRGRFFKAQDLLDEFYASLADRSTPRLMKSLARYDLLVIDELGYLTLNSEQVNAFFKLIDERYSRKSTIITSNLDYPEWYELFQRKHLVDALLDRLQHRCITIRIDGPSLRAPTDQPLLETPVPLTDAKPLIKNTTKQKSLSTHRSLRG